MNVALAIKNQLYPDLYNKENKLAYKDCYLISRRNWLARYALLNLRENNLSEIGKLISDSKKLIKNELNAFPILGEVGAFIIINTDENIDGIDLSQVEVDMTAFIKSVILQGVCIISSVSEKPALKLSNWGSDEKPILFGDCDKILRIISDIIGLETAENTSKV